MEGSNLESIHLLSIPNYSELKQQFVHELTSASQGKNSSLSYLEHILPKTPVVHEGVVQGIVIGGTNYITATVRVGSHRSLQILNRSAGVLPPLSNETTFYSVLHTLFDPSVCAIGLNFGFPMKPSTGPHNELDGILLNETKEHTFHGLIHKQIGIVVSDYFYRQFGKRIPVSCANDTICLCLSGDHNEDGSVIIGTGFNIGLMSNNHGRKVVVNLEAGNFNKFTPSDTLRALDAKSSKPGSQLFEKTLSGKYLALYYDEMAKKLNINIPRITTSQELSVLSQGETNEPAASLARGIIERSAALSACALSAVFDFCQSKKPITLIGEGSLLWDGWHYSQNIESYLNDLGVPQGTVVIKKVNDSSLFGAVSLLIANG